jgi:hypothetical protein
MTRLWLVLLIGCSSSEGGKPPATPVNGSGTPTGCAAMRAKVEQLYRAEAQVKEPKRVDQFVADNTTMVMNDCAKAVDKTVACIERASTVAELEARCVRPLDDEGTEGNALQ